MPKPRLPLALEAFELGCPFSRQLTGFPRNLATGQNVRPEVLTHIGFYCCREEISEFRL